MALDLPIPGGDVTCVAENNLSAKQFYAVELSGANLQVDVCDNAGDRVYGVLQDKPVAGAAGRVRRVGITKWVSDGSGTAIVAGDYVGTNATGKAIKKASAGDFVAGRALSGSSADGTIIDVDLTPNAVLHA